MKNMRLVVLVILLSLAFSEIKGENNNTIIKKENFNGSSTENAKQETTFSEDEIILQKWRELEKLLKTYSSKAVKGALPSLLRLTEVIDISSKCTRSIMMMLRGIKEMKLWAYKMIDASGKIPNGILGGYLGSLGDFDSCLSVEVPGSQSFRGQYCSVYIKPPIPEYKPFHSVDEVLPLFINFTRKETVIHDLTEKAHHFQYVLLRTSICVPSTCSIREISSIATSATDAVGLPFNVSIRTCDVIEPFVFSKSDVAIICLLSVIGLIAFVATIMDVVLNIISKEKRLEAEKSSTAVKCMMCFSTYTNTLRLLKKDNSPDTIKMFHGLKFITLLWVILNHTYYYTNVNVLGGVVSGRDYGKSIAFQVVVNGFFNVETFFFISAVLVAYGRMKIPVKHISIPLYIFRRVWRLTPPLMLIIATSMLVPHMGTGPAWKETIVTAIDKCKANWWTNLIFINNFLSSEEMCFQWLWYIPVDTHLYILALLVIIPLKSRPRLAHGMNILLFIAGTVSTAAAHIYYKLHPTALYIFPHEKDRHYFADNSFFRTYTHVTTCCIGLYVGYFLATRPKLQIPKILNICGWLSSIILALLVVYGVYDWNQGNVPGMFVSTLYACTGKVVWALALSYVTIACSTGNGGIVTSILGWQGIVPLSRLTYVAYIIHPVLQFMYIGSTRVIIPAAHKTFVYRFLANTVAGYGFAYLISLLFESPFMCLEKVMFARKITTNSLEKSKPEENGIFENQFKQDENAISTITMKKINEN